MERKSEQMLRSFIDLKQLTGNLCMTAAEDRTIDFCCSDSQNLKQDLCTAFTVLEFTRRTAKCSIFYCPYCSSHMQHILPHAWRFLLAEILQQSSYIELRWLTEDFNYSLT